MQVSRMNWLQKSLMFAAFLGIGYGTYISWPILQQYLDQWHTKSKKQVTQTLELNPDDDILQITHATEQEGIQTMAQFTDSSGYEESYVFVQNTWYEVGVKRQVRSSGNKLVTSTRTYYPSLYEIVGNANSKDTIILYHIHPNVNNVKREATSKPELTEQEYNSIVIKREEHEPVKRSLEAMFTSDPRADPSINDFGALLTEYKRIWDINPRLKIQSKIVTSKGVTTYTLIPHQAFRLKIGADLESFLELPFVEDTATGNQEIKATNGCFEVTYTPHTF